MTSQTKPRKWSSGRTDSLPDDAFKSTRSMLKFSLALIMFQITLKIWSKLLRTALSIVFTVCSVWAQLGLSDPCGLFHLILRITLGVRYIMVVLQMSQLWFRDVNLPRVTHLGDKVIRLPDSTVCSLRIAILLSPSWQRLTSPASFLPTAFLIPYVLPFWTSSSKCFLLSPAFTLIGSCFFSP